MGALRSDDHDVLGLYPVTTLNYVRRACGDDGVDRVLKLADLGADELPDEEGWLPLDAMMALAEAAATVIGTSELGRLIGEELFADNVSNGLDQVIRSAGNPADAMRMLASFGSRMAGGWTLEVTDCGDGFAEITSYSDLALTTTFFCGTGVGYYSKVPEVFGLRGAATHPECLTRGDDRCRYIVRWVGKEGAASGPTFNFVANVEKQHTVAARLTTAASAEDVVHLAAELAPGVNTGRRFIISADLGHRRNVLAHSGFDESDQAHHIRDLVELGELADEDQPTVCVVRIATAVRDYGWLASVHPARSSIDWTIERTLQSFAGQVASAVEAALTLESARRDRDTAHTLASVARDLAGATTATEISELIQENLSGSERTLDVSVWLLDRSDHVLHRVDGSPDAPAWDHVPAGSGVDPPGTRVVTARSDLSLLHPDGSGVASSTVIALIARGSFIGQVAIGWADLGEPSPDELERYEAIADQAALAFDVVGLVEDLSRQARHDPLSGLANRSLLAERAELAMAQARRSNRLVGLLFVDLDRFKQVNDEFGHAAGDAVICQVADRLRGVVRTQDTVARLGGDEFVVLITECKDDDAAIAAQRVNTAMREPFCISGERLTISATIGVLAAHPDQLPWHALLDQADAAMYRGKQEGRDVVTTV